MTIRNALDEAFVRARDEQHALLILYLTGGFPEKEQFVDLALTILDAGADVLEIGIPYSDPLLDGKTIQASQQAALEAGVTTDDCLRYASEIRARSEKPLLFMGAYNPIFARGLERFCREAAQTGVSGLIVPDLPFEEQDELRRAAGDCGLHLIQMVAPTSTEQRLLQACGVASGFIYCVSVAGVTGARTNISDTARPLVKRARAHSKVPVAVGFGIAGPEQARDVAQYADGAIVGSALINVLAQTPAERRGAEACALVASLAKALGSARL
jgi:tryptophan synthase alpha chain